MYMYMLTSILVPLCTALPNVLLLIKVAILLNYLLPNGNNTLLLYIIVVLNVCVWRYHSATVLWQQQLCFLKPRVLLHPRN